MGKQTESTVDQLNSILDPSNFNFKHDSVLSQMANHLTNDLSRISTDRSSYFKTLRDYRSNYLVNSIYDIIYNDVFVSSTNGGDSINISHPDEDIQDEITSLFRDLNIQEFLKTEFGDVLHYGSYPIKLKTSEEGVTGIDDAYEPYEIITILDGSNTPLFYFSLDSTGDILSSSRTKVEYLDVSNVIVFSSSPSTSKLKLKRSLASQIRKKTPKDKQDALPMNMKVRDYKSFIWSVIDKIQESEVQSKLSTHRNIAQMLTPNLVGVPVPNTYDPTQLVDIVKKYDELINSNININSLADIGSLGMKEIGKIKVVPISGDKGVLQSVSTRSEDRSSSDSKENREDILSTILTALGIPEELFIGQSSSRDNIKTNVRYAKKIKQIQSSLSVSLVRLAVIHLSLKFPDKDIKEDQLTISFRNTTNLDALENLESTDLLISSVNNVMNLLEDINKNIEGSDFAIDGNKFVSIVKSEFESIGSPYADLFIDTRQSKDFKPFGEVEDE